MKLVVYDEIEKFRPSNNPLFDYPYEPRKNMLSEFDFDFEIPEMANGENYDYTIPVNVLAFRLSQVCLEAPYYNQLNIYKEIAQKSQNIWKKVVENVDEVSDDEFECDNTYFQKMKFQNSR